MSRRGRGIYLCGIHGSLGISYVAHWFRKTGRFCGKNRVSRKVGQANKLDSVLIYRCIVGKELFVICRSVISLLCHIRSLWPCANLECLTESSQLFPFSVLTCFSYCDTFVGLRPRVEDILLEHITKPTASLTTMYGAIKGESREGECR